MDKARRETITTGKTKKGPPKRTTGVVHLDADDIATKPVVIGWVAGPALGINASAPKLNRKKRSVEPAMYWLEKEFPDGTRLKPKEVFKILNAPDKANGSIERNALRRARLELGPRYQPA